MQLFRNEMAEEWQQIWLTIDKSSRELRLDVHLVVWTIWHERSEKKGSCGEEKEKTRCRRHRHRPNEWHLIAFPIGALCNLIESVSVKAWCIYYEREKSISNKMLARDERERQWIEKNGMEKRRRKSHQIKSQSKKSIINAVNRLDCVGKIVQEKAVILSSCTPLPSIRSYHLLSWFCVNFSVLIESREWKDSVCVCVCVENVAVA